MKCLDHIRRWKPRKRKLRYMVRAWGFTTNDILRKRALEKRCMQILLLRAEVINGGGNLHAVNFCNLALSFWYFKWWKLCKWVIPTNLPQQIRFNRTILYYESLQYRCESMFRFRGVDLRQVYELLEIPPVVTLPNGSKLGGEEVFLFSLNRLVFPSRVTDRSIEEFGRENTVWSRAFTWFIHHVYERHVHLLNNNLQWWVQHFDSCARAIGDLLTKHGIIFPVGERNTIFGFIDDTLRRTCRPGAEDNNVQRSFYNGWKKLHALKYQSVDLPNGMICDMTKAFSGRRSDLRTLAQSNINGRLRDVQLGNAVQFKAYGDSIFPILSHVRRKHKNNPNTPAQSEQNRVMKKGRVTVEWDYGRITELWGYVDWKKNCKILGHGANISKVYIVCALLSNMHCCLYGSETSDYFNCAPPNLNDYMRQL